MKEWRTLDYHTAGEPLRILREGAPDLPGETMLEKRRLMERDHDVVRRLLMLEPRGHADMYGAILTDPVTADGDCGVLFLHNEGYSTMCGHGIIALATAAVERGIFAFKDPARIRLDTPAGRVTARVRGAAGGGHTAAFENVPAFVLGDPFEVRTATGQPVEVTLAYGGAFYAYVDADALGLPLEPASARQIIALGEAIKTAVNAQEPFRAAIAAAIPRELGFLYGVQFFGSAEHGHSRHACVFAGAELDRSPTGTGVSGRAALEWSKGQLAVGDTLEIESLLATRFKVRCLGTTESMGMPALITEVSGQAHMTGESRFVLDPADPLKEGFLIR